MPHTTAHPLEGVVPDGTDPVDADLDLPSVVPAGVGGSDDMELNGTRPISGTVTDPNRTDPGPAVTE